MNGTTLPAPSGTKRKRTTKQKFYSVRVGRTPGIYLSWDECHEQTRGVPNASFKSFPALSEAQEFLEGKGSSTNGIADAKTKKWYAVRSGRVPGVYTDWADVLVQISGWKTANHKSFQSRAEAERYVAEGGETKDKTNAQDTHPSEPSDGPAPPAKKSKPSKNKKAAAAARDEFDLDLDAGEWEAGDGPLPEGSEDTFDATIIMDQATGVARYKTAEEHARTKLVAVGPAPGAPIKIYTDGSSLGNGKANSVSGVGVYFGPKDKRNLSEPLAGAKQTNQRAELTAILRALEVAPRDHKILIFSDSNYGIKCVTEWFQRWRTNGWVNAAGKPVDNRDLVQKILEILEDRQKVNRHRTDANPNSFRTAGLTPQALAETGPWEHGAAGVKFVWVKGHAANEGNNAADALATQAAREAKELLSDDFTG